MNTDNKHYNFDNLILFTKRYLNYISKRVSKDELNNLSSFNLNISNSNFQNENFNMINANSNNLSENKDEFLKDFFIKLDIEIYKQLYFNLIIDLNYILLELQPEEKNEIYEIIYNDNDFKIDIPSSKRFSNLTDSKQIIEENNIKENYFENVNRNLKVKHFLSFDFNGKYDSDRINLELKIHLYSNENNILSKNKYINNLDLSENAFNRFTPNNINITNRKKFKRMNTSNTRSPKSFKGSRFNLLIYNNF